jgi:trimeric autotransporter adhesin
MRLLTALAVLALSSSALSAQSIYGGLRGLVSDPGAAVIANAKVSLTNAGTNDTRSTVTSATGEYVFSQVIPATYTVTVESPGFKKFTRTGIIVETQNQISVDVKLEVGQVTETVMVTEEVPLIETATASQGQMIDRQKMIDLPNLGRNPYMFSRLAPNVQQVGNPAYARMQDQSGSSQISIAGGPVRGNNYLLDGVPITDMANRAIIIASLEAVQEMKVQANTYDAEIGRSGGGMFNAFLKSGTNDYHGSLAGYMRQTEWVANSFFSNRAGRPVTEQPFRNYMGSFGGRVWIPKVYDGKNRTFFWGVFEGYRDTQANAGATAVPTLAERTGDFSQSRISAANQGIRLMYDPLTTTADGVRTPFAGNIIPAARISPVGRAIAATFPNPRNAPRFLGDLNQPYEAQLPSKADQKTLKFDHKVTEFWNANLSYLRYNSLEPGENWFRDSVSSPQQWTLDRKVDSTQFNNTLTLNPTTVLAVRYGFNRFPNLSSQSSAGYNVAGLGFASNFVRDIPSLTFPRVQFENFYPGDAMGTNSNALVVPHSKNLVGMISKFVGRHSLKMGGDFRRIQMDGVTFGNSSGNFVFNDQFTRANFASGNGQSGSDLASLLLGNPTSADGFIPTKMFQYVNYVSGFVHDDIRINNKLTVNVGVRWERESGLTERNNNLITGFNRDAVNSISAASGVPTRGAVMFAGVNGSPRSTGNPDMNKLSPRFGVAYQLNAKTTIRGGYGIFWAPAFAYTGPYLPEGFTASSQPLATTDGGRTPALNLGTIFANGLDKPVGSGLGDQTGIGKALTILDQNARSPYVQQYSFDIQRELPFGVALSVGYVGSRSSRLSLTAADINVNQLEPRHFSRGVAGLSAATANPYFNRGGAAGIGTANVSQAQLLRPFPAFGNLNLSFSDYGRARYDSLVVRAQKRLSQGLTFLTAWTFSKNLDNVAGGAGNNLNAGNVAPQNAYDLNSEWGLSYLDSPHRLSMAFTYELPFGKGRAMMASAPRALDYLIGGWSINGAGVMNAGFPLMIRQNSNNNSVAFTASQRPNATGINPFGGGEKKDWIDANGYLNNAAFSLAPALTFGNVSRTIDTRGLRQTNWDLSLFKTFTIVENFKAQFRAEALNAMNTPMFRSPNTAFGNSAFGRITAQANFSRMYQLGLRLFF